jgi:hypothetical protein
MSTDPSPTAPARRDLPESRVRSLLRRLRDLNLRGAEVAVARGATVRIDGCLSVDDPVETELRYRLRPCAGEPALLNVAAESGAIRMVVSDLAGLSVQRARRVPVFADAEDRATAPCIAARMDLERADARQAEHFLRRLVRAAYAAGGGAERESAR